MFEYVFVRIIDHLKETGMSENEALLLVTQLLLSVMSPDDVISHTSSAIFTDKFGPKA